jgi:hypothetical protein
MVVIPAWGAPPGHPKDRADWVKLETANASGLGVNVPVVGRLSGGGGVLYTTALDVTNNATTAAQVDFYVDLTDVVSGAPVVVDASVSSSGALVAQGTGGSVAGKFNAHFDDFIDALVQAGLIPASAESDGVLGSVLFIFNGFTRSGKGAVSARFYNSFGGGTIGTSLSGHEITTSEPTKLVATLRDSRQATSGPKLYANIFLNNTGLTPTGTGTATAIDIQVSAYSAATGQPVGTPVTIQAVNPGATTVVSDIFTALQVPSSERAVIVTANVTSGTAAIEGVAVEVDNTTHDGSGNAMARGDF